MSEENGTDPDAVADETFVQTAPNLPWELLFRSCAWFFQKVPGGMILKIIPTVHTPQGAQMMPPGIEVHFDMNGWAEFQGDVRRDGAQSPVLTATRMPGPGR